MCGSIKQSKSAEQAVDFAISFAKSFETDFWGDPLPEEALSMPTRQRAKEFIEAHTPADHRAEAQALLASRTELSSQLNYWHDVIE